MSQNDENEVKIAVSGRTGLGTRSVAAVVADLLRGLGVEVAVDDGDDPFPLPGEATERLTRNRSLLRVSLSARQEPRVAAGPPEVFVVTLEDRHADPDVSVHLTRAGADARFEEHKAAYGDKLWEWTADGASLVLEGAGNDGWVRYERATHDDGPSVRVERLRLEP